jgi:hypothetical protein
MRSKFLVTFVVLIATVFACTYSPDSEFINPIEPPQPSDFSISLNNIDEGDTITLYGPGNFSYNINSAKGKVETVRITLGDKYVGQGNGNTGSFTINYPALQTGTWELKLGVISSSGNGSLADKMNVEKVELWKKWIVKIDVDPPTSRGLTLTVENGYQVLRWTPYDKKNFVGYKLIVSYPGLSREFDFDDPKTSLWIDSAYVGFYQAKYQFYVTNSVSTLLQERIVAETLDFDVSYNAFDSSVTLSLPKPKFYGAFGRYEIGENGIARMQIENHNQTNVTFKLLTVGFNYTANLSLGIFSKDPDHPNGFANKGVDKLVVPRKFYQPFKSYHYNVERNVIAAFRESGTTGQIVLLNPTTMVPLDSVNIHNGPSYSIPYRGNFVYYSRPKDLVQVNLITHEEKSFPAITTTFGSGPSQITAANGEVVSYGWFGPAPTTGVIYYGRVFDMESGQTIYTYESPSGPYNHILSCDGIFLCSNILNIYRITGLTTNLTGKLTTTGKLIGFRDDRTDEIMSASGHRVYIYDANTLSLKRIVAAPVGSTFQTYDVIKGKLVFNDASAGKIYVVDIEDAETRAYNAFTGNFAMLNGILFTSQGEYIKLY